MLRLHSLVVLLICSLWLAPGTATGEPQSSASAEEQSMKELAQSHLTRGIEAFRAQRYKDAIDAFQQAYELYPSAAISFNIARAYESLEDVSAALRFYREYLRQAPEARDATEVSERIERFEDQLRLMGVQQVTIVSKPSGATLSVDGSPVGITPWTGELHPGHHQLELHHAGFASRQERFRLSPHRALDLELALEARPKAVPVRADEASVAVVGTTALAPTADAVVFDYLPWLSFGAAGVALAGAAYFEFSSAQAEEDARRTPTQQEALRHVRSMQSAQTTARVLLGVGSALALTGGVTLWLRSGSSEEAAEVHVACGLSACTLEGAF